MRKLIGDKAFYKMVLLVAIPIMVQNGITNFVSLLDNIMVGRVGTAQMSGVAIANQLLFVFNLAIFGAISGAGIFAAQFFGSGDHEGVRFTMRYKLIICVILLAICYVLIWFKGEELIALFLNDADAGDDIALTLREGKKYMHTMLVGLVPFIFSQCYASTLRETGETVLPMKAGITAVFVNLALNYVLIFGHFGMPAMGVQGAAVATVISRFVETAMIMLVVHRNQDQYRFAEGLYRSLRIPKTLVKAITIKGTPLMLNELLWSMGMSVIMQSYSLRGLSAIASLNINSTVFNLFSTVYFAMGSAISIIIGQQLGAGETEKARDTDAKLIFFAVALSAAVGVIAIAAAPLIPQIYNTTEEVRDLATQLIQVSALCMPLGCFVQTSYFTLRSGGKTVVTFLFDCVYVWMITIPTAFILARFTALPIVPLYLVVQLMDIIKAVVGFILVKKGVWVHNIVAAAKEEAV